MAPVLLRAPTRSTFLTAASRPSTTTPTTLMVTSPRSHTPELLLTLRLSLLPTTLWPTPLLLPTLLPLSTLDTALSDTDLLDTVSFTLDKQELPQQTFKK